LDIAREQQERRLPHGGPVRAVAFSPDGLRLATASDDRAARVWDIASGQEEQIFSHGGPVRAVAFSPDGHRLATASGNAASVWALGEEGQDD
jgi:WD40 repeat protein